MKTIAPKKNKKKGTSDQKKGKCDTKCQPAKKRNYYPTKLHQALEEVKDGTLSARKASDKYGVPRSTLGFRFSPKFVKAESGPPTALTSDEELTLVKWITECGRKEFPRRRLDLQQSVEGFLHESPRKNPFANNRPGKTWIYSFLRRHPELTYRTSEAVTPASSTVSIERNKIWFHSVEELLDKEGHLDILQDPTRIFNGDETNFLLWPKNSKVLALKGSRNVYEVDGGAAKSSLTAMFSFSADGACVPPMIVYPYKTIPQEIISSVPDGWGIGRSDSGWMTSEIFYEYIANIFNRFLEDKAIKKPIVLFVDGHKSHLNYQLSQLCTHLEIILVALYPNSTRILQPADVAAFKPLKEGWKKAALEWRFTNPNQQITKVNVGPILKDVVSNKMTRETLKNGFRASGIFPWNYENIDSSKCLGSDHNSVFQKEDRMDKSLNHEFINLVGDRVVNDVTNNGFETCSSTPDELFIALKSLCTFFGTTCFMNDESRPSVASKSSIVIEVPPACTDESASDQVISAEISEPSNDGINVMELATGDTVELHLVLRDESQEEESDRAVELIVLKKTKHGPIDEWLIWPKTPEKKGKRVQKMMPYVITSEAWKTEKEEEMKKKEEARKVKEERATKIKEAKESKEEGKKGSKKAKKKVLGGIPVRRPQRRLMFSEEDDQDEVVLESDSEEHTRMDGPNCPIHDLILNSDNEFIRGMCFICTGSLNATNPGCACDVCDKLYHNKCETLSAEESGLGICPSCNCLSQELQLNVDEGNTN